MTSSAQLQMCTALYIYKNKATFGRFSRYQMQTKLRETSGVDESEEGEV